MDKYRLIIKCPLKLLSNNKLSANTWTTCRQIIKCPLKLLTNNKLSANTWTTCRQIIAGQIYCRRGILKCTFAFKQLLIRRKLNLGAEWMHPPPFPLGVIRNDLSQTKNFQEISHAYFIQLP